MNSVDCVGAKFRITPFHVNLSRWLYRTVNFVECLYYANTWTLYAAATMPLTKNVLVSSQS